MPGTTTALVLTLAMGGVEPARMVGDPFADAADDVDTSAPAAGTEGTDESRDSAPSHLAVEATPDTPPGEARATIPGVPPGVELFDESTWASLSVEEKDRMRAIRAEILYQQRQAGVMSASVAPAPRLDPTDRPPRRSEYARRAYREEWEARDSSLATTTAVMGLLWGVGLITTVVLAAQVRKEVDDCSDSIDDVNFDASACTSTIRNVRGLTIGAWFTGVVATGAGVGTIVAGSFLGAHRSRRPSFAGAEGRRVALRPGGIRIRF